MALRCPEELIGDLDTSLLPEGSLSGGTYKCRKPAVLHCSGVQGKTAPLFSGQSYLLKGSSISHIGFLSTTNHLHGRGLHKPYPLHSKKPENRINVCKTAQTAAAARRRLDVARSHGCLIAHFEDRTERSRRTGADNDAE